MRITESQLRRIIREELSTGRNAIIFPKVDNLFRVIAYDIDELEKSMQEKHPSNNYRGVIAGVVLNPPEGTFGPCNNAWHVATAASNVRGWGTKVYTAALTRLDSVSSDRTEVSPEAERLWMKLNSLGHISPEPFDNIANPQTPPPDDDCKILYRRDPSINRSYRLRKSAPSEILDLIEAGERHMEELKDRGVADRYIRALTTGYSILFSKRYYG